MNRFLLAIIAVGLLSNWSVAAPVPPEPTGPSPEAKKQIDARRAHFEHFNEMPRRAFTPEQLAEHDRLMQPRLEELAAALASRDPFVYDEAVRDLVNGHYRNFPPEKLRSLLLPLLKTPEKTPIRIDAQAWVMNYLSHRDMQASSKAAVPDLLRILADDKVSPYLRGSAVDAAARIAPGDRDVLEAFISALGNPNPTNRSGVHDRIAERLGEMGRAAAPAKKALIKLFDRGEWYQDPAYIALGKIERDETPKVLADYLDRLGKLDKLPVEQGAAAFMHIVEQGRTGEPGNWRVVPEVARAALPVLLAVVESRPNDVHSRAALRALADLGPWSEAGTAKVLVKALMKYHDALDAARKAILAVDPGAAREAKSQELFWPIYSHNRNELLLTALDRIDPAQKDAVEPLAEALARFAPKFDEWPIGQRLAKNLARFGTAARPAVPTALTTLKSLPLTEKQDVYAELFVDYLGVLAAAGGDAPGARQAVLEYLNPDGPTLKKSGPNAPMLRFNLLLTLARLGLPADGDERTAALRRTQEGLATDRIDIFSAATKVVAAATKLTPEEAAPLVKGLVRVLAKDFAFPPTPQDIPSHLAGGFTYDEALLLGRGLTLRALGALGPLAREALPEVRALAKQELEKRTSDFIADPPINAVILEARKAEKQIDKR
jgi:hypothetical protein